MKCAINTTDELDNQTTLDAFNSVPLTIKTTDAYTTIIFQYNMSKCGIGSMNNLGIGYNCTFHVVTVDRTNSAFDYTFTMNKRAYSAFLREGHLAKDMIYKNEYLYYQFGLSSLEGVISITVFVTVIEGDIFLLSSTEDMYPTLETNSTNLKFSSSNTLFYARDQIASKIYISVYSLEFSEFTIGVTISRVGSSTNSTSNNDT